MKEVLVLIARVQAMFAEYADKSPATDLAIASYDLGYKEGRDNEARNKAIPVNTALGRMLLHIASNEPIQAIRVLREAQGLGLKEAKDFVDALRALAKIGGF